MQWTTTFALAAALATGTYAQSQCTTSSYDGRFTLSPVNVTAASMQFKRSLVARQADCSAPGSLVVQLQNGVLTDSQGRIGSIVANYQFQFDGPPPQAGALVVDGYAICANNTLASNGQAVWWQCSDLTRTSIYGPNLTPIGAACYQVYYQVTPCAGSGASASGGSGAAVSTMTDGQPAVTSSSCVPVTTLSDGQPVVSTCPPATTPCVPVTTLSDGQPVVSSCPIAAPTSTCVPITTMSDGQPVVSSCPTAAPTSTCVPITTMSDGQPVVSSCPTAAPISTCVPITTMSDGQPVVSSCPTTTVPSSTAVLGQISDGQVQATGAGPTSSSVPSGFLSVNAGSPAFAVDSRVGVAVAAAFAVLFV